MVPGQSGVMVWAEGGAFRMGGLGLVGSSVFHKLSSAKSHVQIPSLFISYGRRSA